MGRTVTVITLGIIVALASALPTPAVEDEVAEAVTVGMDEVQGARQDTQGPASPGTKGPSSIELKRFADGGQDVGPVAVSPDGSRVAYVFNEKGQDRVVLRQLAAGTETTLVVPKEPIVLSLQFSGDGAFVYYTALEQGEPPLLYRLAASGGEPKVLHSEKDMWAPTASPDGTQVALVRRIGDDTSLVIRRLSDGTERPIATRREPRYFGGLAWSREGDALVVIDERTPSEGVAYEARLVSLNVKSGTAHELGVVPLFMQGEIAWVGPGDRFLLVGAESRSAEPQLWTVRYPGPVLERVTQDLNRYGYVSIAGDGRTIVAAALNSSATIWWAERDRLSSPRQVTTSGARRDGAGGMAWAPDGSLIYTSVQDGVTGIWSVDAKGVQRQHLTSGEGFSINPSVTPDGETIVFQSNRSGVSEVWRVRRDGSSATKLTTGEAYLPFLTADGRFAVYGKSTADSWTDYMVPLTGGTPQLLLPAVKPGTESTDKARGSDFRVLSASPDGQWLAGWYGAKWKLAVVAADGSKWTDLGTSVNSSPLSLAWMPDSKTLTYVRRVAGVDNVWTHPVGGRATQVTNFASGQISRAAWSRDGRRLALSRSERSGDVVLIRLPAPQ